MEARLVDVNLSFQMALNLEEHPVKWSRKQVRFRYLEGLSYVINEAISLNDENEKRYIIERLWTYQKALGGDAGNGICHRTDGLKALRSFLRMPWRKKYSLMLACDASLILLGRSSRSAIEIINGCLTRKGQGEICNILSLLSCEKEIDKKYRIVVPLITQYRLNRRFLSQHERRIVVTANMSAGKSTLINALVGRRLAQTSQEACTGNVCYFFNKAFEDGHVHLSARQLTLNATDDELRTYEWERPVFMASYFSCCVSRGIRLCIVDTPGINTALHRSHADITREVLRTETYDMVLYVVSPTNLGTDAEVQHLKWVAQNLPSEKIVFVLNKLDNYREGSDSIEESIYTLKKDLMEYGFKSPVICPISAYFSYLLKLKMTGQDLSDDEAEEYAYLSRKFMRSSYDLSRYYGDDTLGGDATEELKLSKRAGLHGLEKIINGGLV